MKESKTVNELIDTTTKSAALTVKPETLKLKRRLTMDATSLVRLKQVICRIDGEFETIDMGKFNPDGSMQTATAIPITDVVTNDTWLLICNSLIVSSLARSTPPLTGRYFAMKAGEIKAGKRYRQVEVFELEVAP